MEWKWDMLSKRSLGDQLDAWCDMLAAASAAVGAGARSPPGMGGPGLGLRVPRPPPNPRPAPNTGLGSGHLAGLTLPHAAKPPPGPVPQGNKSSRRKSTTKKSSSGSGTTKSKDDTRKKHKTKGKGRTKSRLQMTQSHPNLTSTGLSSKSDSWTTVSNIGGGVGGVLSANNNNSHLRVLNPHPPLAPPRSSVISTTQVSDSESDSSDSEIDCAEDDAPQRELFSSHVNLTRASESTNSLIHPHLISPCNKDGAERRPSCSTKEVTTIRPLHPQQSTQDRLSSQGALSISISNLARLPEVVLNSQDTQSCEVSTTTQTQRSTRSKISSPGKTALTEPPKKKQRPSIISLVKPLNQEAEKAKFMQSRNYEYNPQFQYKAPIDQSAYKKYFKPEYRLMPLALKVLQNVLFKHGTYEKFAKQSGGRELTREQILELVMGYLKEEGLEDEVVVKLSPDLVSRACMTRVKGRPLLQVQTNNVHEGWMDGLLRHEIGTHYMRSCNNRCQVWRRPKKRRELDLCHQNPTEEGLASIHSVIFRDDPCMWRAAMLYYTVVRASDLSFSALFHDLAKFAREPAVRWDYCLRAKRGLSDTSEPGAFTKDQVYLKGALEILKNRKKINFHALLRLGKVSYRDVDRLMGTANFHNTRIPRFMRDLDHYHKKLDEIIVKNGLTEADLEHV